VETKIWTTEPAVKPVPVIVLGAPTVKAGVMGPSCGPPVTFHSSVPVTP